MYRKLRGGFLVLVRVWGGCGDVVCSGLVLGGYWEEGVG